MPSNSPFLSTAAFGTSSASAKSRTADCGICTSSGRNAFEVVVSDRAAVGARRRARAKVRLIIARGGRQDRREVTGELG